MNSAPYVIKEEPFTSIKEANQMDRKGALALPTNPGHCTQEDDRYEYVGKHINQGTQA